MTAPPDGRQRRDEDIDGPSGSEDLADRAARDGHTERWDADASDPATPDPPEDGWEPV